MGITRQFLLNIIDFLIILAVLFVCAILPLFSYRRIGRAAILAASGFVLLMAAWLLDVAFSVWAVFGYEHTDSADIYETMYWTKTALRIPVMVMGFLLLVAAILVRRPPNIQPAS